MDHIKKYLITLLILVAHFLNPAKSNLHQQNSSKHFVLVHGKGHGAWCWYKLIPLLQSSGHNVTALDLAASGINPKQVSDVPFLSDYFAPLIDFMASLPPNEKVILVGHSFGGFAISLAMEKFPNRVSLAVFVAAVMPGPLTNFTTFTEQELRSFGDATEDNVYQLSPIQDLTLATLLVRPSHPYGVEDVSRTLRLSNENYGSVSRVVILPDQDKLLKKFFQQWMIKENPPDEVREVTDSDHMVMMSQPNELLVQLLDISLKYSDETAKMV